MPGPEHRDDYPDLEAPAFLGHAEVRDSEMTGPIATPVSAVTIWRYFIGLGSLATASFVIWLATIFAFLIPGALLGIILGKTDPRWLFLIALPAIVPVICVFVWRKLLPPEAASSDTRTFFQMLGFVIETTTRRHPFEEPRAWPLPDESRARVCPFCGTTFEGPLEGEPVFCPLCERENP